MKRHSNLNWRFDRGEEPFDLVHAGRGWAVSTGVASACLTGGCWQLVRAARRVMRMGRGAFILGL